MSGIDCNYFPIFSTSFDNFPMPAMLENNRLRTKHPFALKPRQAWMSAGLLFTFRRNEILYNQLYSHVCSEQSFPVFLFQPHYHKHSLTPIIIPSCQERSTVSLLSEHLRAKLCVRLRYSFSRSGLLLECLLYFWHCSENFRFSHEPEKLGLLSWTLNFRGGGRDPITKKMSEQDNFRYCCEEYITQ